MTCGDNGGVTVLGRPCARTAGWGTGGSTGRCITHLGDSPPLGSTTAFCGDFGGFAESTQRPCKRKAGWGLPNMTTGPCRTHTNEEVRPPVPPVNPSATVPSQVFPTVSAAPTGWDGLIQNQTLNGNVVVPSNTKWLIGANVVINRGSLIAMSGTSATVGMRPGSKLTFTGGIPDEYVGGGMTWDETRQLDFGLWIGHGCKLDIQGTPKTKWGRTGMLTGWNTSDEMYLSPTTTPGWATRWYSGNPIPTKTLGPGQTLPPTFPSGWATTGIPAEVGNVTSDIEIAGVGHIHLHPHSVVNLQYFTVRGLGVTNKAFGEAVTGRYALHLHHGTTTGIGSIFRGIAFVDCMGRQLVVHGVHGVTVEDILCVNGRGEGFWWDMRNGPADRSDDMTVDKLCVMGVYRPRSMSGNSSYVSAIVFSGGDRNAMTNSVASGSWGSKLSHGMDWPSGADSFGHATWTFEAGNMSHTNEGSGLRFWNNNTHQHVTKNVITYANEGNGVENGAYLNANFFEDILMIDDKLNAQANGSHKERETGTPMTYRRMQTNLLFIGHIRLASFGVGQFYDDCTFGEVMVGNNTRNKWVATFKDCTVGGSPMQPADIQWPNTADMVEPSGARSLDGSVVTIDNGPGDQWRVNVVNLVAGNITVTPIVI